MITLNDKFKAEYDGRQWVLHETYMGEVRVKGDAVVRPKERVRRSYHGTLRQACNKVVDVSAASCGDAETIINMLDKAGWVLEGQASGFIK